MESVVVGSRLACIVVTLLLFGLPAFAHDVRGIANPNLHKEAELTQADLQAALAQQSDANSRYVIERASLWTPGQTLRLCFIGGDSSERSVVQNEAEALFQQAKINLKLAAQGDCQKGANGRYFSELRVALNDGCCSAYIGRQSLAGSIATGANIFLQGTNDSITIKHEFIHALGFHHEHQKPTSPCNFKYDVISSSYGWPLSEVRNNFNRLQASSTKYIWDAGFDVESAMKYFFDPDFLAEGTASPCYFPQATRLSTSDITGLQRAYPATFDMTSHRAKLANKAAVSVPTGSALKDLLAAFPND